MTMEANFQLVKMPENHDYVEMSYSPGNGEGYAVLGENNARVGYVWIEMEDNNAYIEMIEVFDKGNGHGTNIIKFLFEQYNLSEMSGSVKHDYDATPYFFWLSMGADINVEDEDEYLECCYDGHDVSFTLTKECLSA